MVRPIATAVSDAVRKELDARRAYLDQTPDLARITITLQLQAGTAWVRKVGWHEVKIARRTRHAT